MKIVISILLSIFILAPQVFADDGVKDPAGITDCNTNVEMDLFKNLKDKKPIKVLKCKDLIRWSSTIDININEDFPLEIFVFEAKKEKDKWWLKVKPRKGKDFLWIAKPGGDVEPTMPGTERIGQETEMSTKWDGKIYPKPEFKNPKSAEELTNAVFKELKKVNGRLWVRVEIIASDCAPADDRPVLAAGWIPFMHSNTESNFYSEQDCTP